MTQTTAHYISFLAGIIRYSFRIVILQLELYILN